ncbi:MAG: hypothetical protein AAGC77_03480 [Pseudomonadota bacterium]
MTLRIFPVVGEALHFGSRRFETIMRVAWLPVILLLILNMATVFAYLSVIAGRPITLIDFNSLLQAERTLARFAARGWSQNPEMMGIITFASLSLQAVMIASFMAPLIRLAGLGVEPRPGFARFVFGADQIRFIVASILNALVVGLIVFAPMSIAALFLIGGIIDALSQTFASFPNENSLHTIELITMADRVAAGEAGWFDSFGAPLAAAIPFAFFAWLLVYLHFHPRNRPSAPVLSKPVTRAVVTLIVFGLVAFGAYFLFSAAAAGFWANSLGVDAALVPGAAWTSATLIILFSFLILFYASLRLSPYPGVAVCRSSLAPGPTLRVTQGWNILRILVIVVMLWVLLTFIQTVVINVLLLNVIFPWVINYLYAMTAVSTRLVNSGVTGEWVGPVFIWSWNFLKIAVNVLWTFFSYGVAAGLYGRLYKASVAER